MLQHGDRIDTWVVERPLGAGGMGSVYLCHNQSTERFKAAVKVLEGKHATTEKGKSRFVREAEILHSLDHPNVVRVLNLRLDWDPAYIAMEFVDGESLDEHLRRGQPPLERALGIMRQMAAAVEYLHAHGVRHRDLKPANVLLERNGDGVKLVDFGVALDVDVTRLTSEGTRIGTPAYAPPEWLGSGPVDPVASDLYALGVCFYEIITGIQPYATTTGSTRQQVLQLMLAKQAAGPLDPGEPYPAPLREVVRRLTDGDPGRRGTAADIPRVLAGEMVPTRTAATTVEVTPAPSPRSEALTVQLPPASRPALAAPRSRWPWVVAGLASLVLGAPCVGLVAWMALPAGAPELPPPPVPPPPVVVAPPPAVVAPAPAVVDPAPIAPAPVAPAPPRPAPAPKGRVTNAAFSSWLAQHPEWARDALVAGGRADGAYLEGLGAAPASGPVFGTTWMVAAAYCEGRGGLTPIDGEPATWDPGTGVLLEWRQAPSGVPAWRSNDGRTSTAVAPGQSNLAAGFRCRG